MREPEKIHVYPIDGHGRTTHVVDTDGMCFCKPVNKQVCSEAEWSYSKNNWVCDESCWRCAGEAVCEPYDPQLNVIVIHCEGQKPVYPSALPMIQQNGSHNTTPADKPHKCPVCHGHGFVPDGFYGPISNVIHVISSEREKCRSCDGEGLVWG